MAVTLFGDMNVHSPIAALLFCHYALLLGAAAGAIGAAVLPGLWPLWGAITVGTGVLVRAALVAVHVSGDSVIIRNIFRTHRLDRAEVLGWEGVTVYPVGRPTPGLCLGARTSAGVVKALGTFRVREGAADEVWGRFRPAAWRQVRP